MKRRLVSVITMILFLLTTPVVFADEPVYVKVNGQNLISDTEAIIVNGRAMVPFAAVFEALGVSRDNIKWDGSNNTVTAKKGNKTLELKIGSYDIKDNNKIYKMDVKPIIRNSRTMVPVRFVSEHMDANVKWDNPQRTVFITYDQNKNNLDELLGDDFQKQLEDEIEKQEKARIEKILKEEEELKNKKESEKQKENLNDLKDLQTKKAAAINNIEGYYAIQDSSKNKFIGFFKADGKISITSLKDKKVSEGTYKIKDKQISISSIDIGGSYTITENMYNGWKIIVLNNTKDKSLVLTPITLEVYQQYSK